MIIDLAKKISGVVLTIFSKTCRYFSRKKNNSSPVIAVIALHKLGDTVFTIPAITYLHQIKKNKLYIFCYKESQSIYQHMLKNVEYKILNVNDFFFNGRIVNSNSRKLLREIRPDLLIDMTGSITSVSLIFNITNSIIIGINDSNYKGIYDHFEKIRTTPHQIDLYFDSIKPMFQKFEYNFNGYSTVINNQTKILIHPLAGWKAKEWGVNKYMALYDKLITKYDCSFIFPKNSFRDDIIKQFNLKRIKYLECNDTEQLMDYIRDFGIFVSNDSGPLQIAAMLKKPTFGIYGPTNPDFHLPLGNNHGYINLNIKCSPGENKYCFTDAGRNCPDFKCMKDLSVEKVYESLVNFLDNLETQK